MTIQHATGRTYDKPQVLHITIESQTADEFGLIDLVATFVDASRHISGRVNTVQFPHETVGVAVLAAYDYGNYASI